MLFFIFCLVKSRKNPKFLPLSTTIELQQTPQTKSTSSSFLLRPSLVNPFLRPLSRPSQYPQNLYLHFISPCKKLPMSAKLFLPLPTLLIKILLLTDSLLLAIQDLYSQNPIVQRIHIPLHFLSSTSSSVTFFWILGHITLSEHD